MKWNRVVVVVAGATMAGGLALTPSAPASASTSPIQWLSHRSTLRAGHQLVLTLRRTSKAEVCSLVVSKPGQGKRTWTYPQGSGRIQFAIDARAHALAGVWHYTARCVPVGTTDRQTAHTSLRITHSYGSEFVASHARPLFQVPVKLGETNPSVTPPNGGRGGDDPGDDYPANLKYAPQDSLIDAWGEYNRECTSFVAWALHSRNGYEMPFHDNAIGWGYDAEARGIAVDSNPTVGSVAWSNHAPFGHVAWVTAVNGSQVTISEYNEHYNGTFDERVVSSSAFTGYIHFKDLPQGGNPQPVTNTDSGPTPTSGSGTSTTYGETTGGVTHTWTDYSSAGGTQGPSISSNQTVQISCRLNGFTVADGNTWWYQIASSPWNEAYYASADAFYNNGATSGTLYGTPYVDPTVPVCGSAPPPPPPPTTVAETTGGVTHTWANYTNAGGTQGPSIATNQTVQITCRLEGFQVADGNTWWYKIASDPWDNNYYASADAFYNNGATSGSLSGTPFVDPAVPSC